VKDAWEREPFIRLRQYLSDNGHWDEATEKAWLVECATRVDAEVNAYLESKPQPVESMFDYLYAELPVDLEQQRAAALAREAK
ncbi:MAG: pyruvate dehydrogenase (acetyl-transferring) E1 component subunit alpha, partial [Xanthomonadales bacterium]|nr:pyruvate dehydrogenase (acetyl-transferring) E1 component subunit alpha [Xanthomonadales bacterium]